MEAVKVLARLVVLKLLRTEIFLGLAALAAGYVFYVSTGRCSPCVLDLLDPLRTGLAASQNMILNSLPSFLHALGFTLLAIGFAGRDRLAALVLVFAGLHVGIESLQSVAVQQYLFGLLSQPGIALQDSGIRGTFALGDLFAIGIASMMSYYLSARLRTH